MKAKKEPPVAEVTSEKMIMKKFWIQPYLHKKQGYWLKKKNDT